MPIPDLNTDQILRRFLEVVALENGLDDLQAAADFLFQEIKNEIEGRKEFYGKLNPLLHQQPLDLPAIRQVVTHNHNDILGGHGSVQAQVSDFFKTEPANKAQKLILDLIGDFSTIPNADQIDTFIQEAATLSFGDKSAAGLFASVILTSVFPDNFVDFRQYRWVMFRDLFNLDPLPASAGYGQRLVWAGKIAVQVANSPTFQQFFKADKPNWAVAGLVWHIHWDKSMQKLINAPRIWKISAGESGKHWTEFQKEQLIGIGFDQYWQEDLSQFKDYDNLLEGIRQYAKTGSRPKYAAEQFWFLYQQMIAGDIVLAYGNGVIVGAGKLTGPYQYNLNPNFPYPHQRPVEWTKDFNPVSISQLSSSLHSKLTKRETIIPLTTAEYSEIIKAPPPINPLSTLSGYFASKGYHFSDNLLATFITALQTKGFVILSGLSGTGKTKLAQHLAELLNPAESATLLTGNELEVQSPFINHCFISVRPDWRDSKNLLGYYNPLTSRYDDTRFLHFLMQAKAHYDQAKAEALPHFVILDEMNLARIEYYFADFLSVLESGRNEQTGYTQEAIALHHRPIETTLNSKDQPIPQSLALPPNLYIIGTVNMDETTHAFSPKVLDRAFTIECNEVDFTDYPPNGAAYDDNNLAELQTALLTGFQREGQFAQINKNAITEAVQIDDWNYGPLLQILNQALAPHDFHFGYRTFDEIAQFVIIASENNLFDNVEAAFDVAVLMKVLPKFNGPRSRLRQPLEAVIAWAKTPDEPKLEAISDLLKDAHSCRDLLTKLPDEFTYPEAARKAIRMLIRLYETGFASFA